jgi:hypothetical protein
VEFNGIAGIERLKVRAREAADFSSWQSKVVRMYIPLHKVAVYD